MSGPSKFRFLLRTRRRVKVDGQQLIALGAAPSEPDDSTGNSGARSHALAMVALGFNVLFLRRFWTLCAVAVKKRTPALLLAGLLAIAIVYEFIAYQVGLITSKYYVVLANRDLHGFWMQTLLALGLIFGVSKVRALRTFVANTTGVQCRKHLTEDLQGLYFAAKGHYTVNVLDASLDNPDQRMTQDVDRFTQRLAETLPPILIVPFTTGYYIYSAYVATGWTGPVSTFLFFILFTVINKFLMSPVVPRVYELEKQEGQFRYEHSRIRAHSESIAFLDGEPIELDNTNGILKGVVKAQQSVLNRQLPLNLGVHLFDYIGSILSLLVIAVPIFNGVYDDLPPAELTGVISKNAFITIYLISCYSSIVDLSGSVTIMAGNTHRIAALRERLQCIAMQKDQIPGVKQDASHDSDAEDGTTPSVELLDVTYKSPRDNTVLVDKLTLVCGPKRNMLVTGPSGSGKTTLLRVIKGLRDVESGSIHTKNASSMSFMPQVPWLSTGSLRAQIRYPTKDYPGDVGDEDAEMRHLLRVCGIEHLLESAYSLDTELDAAWYGALSPGEKQRLSWARLLYHRPCLAFLDEATAAVGPEATAKLHRECKERDITVVAVGYQRSVEGWEPELVLEIKGNNGYWDVVHKERGTESKL